MPYTLRRQNDLYRIHIRPNGWLMPSLRQGEAVDLRTRMDEEWRQVEDSRERWERPLQRDLAGMFQDQAARLDGALQAQGFRSVRQDGLVLDQVFDLSAALEEIREIYGQHMMDLIEKGFELGLVRLGVDGDFDDTDALVQSAIRQLNEQARQIPLHTREILSDVITRGQAAQKDTDTIAREMVERVDSMSTTRATRIARTSVTTTTSAGQESAWASQEYHGSAWISQRDSRVRRSHFDADGQVSQTGGVFKVGRATLDYPGDPDGPPGEIVNCRCSRLPFLDESDADRFIQQAQEQGLPHYVPQELPD